MAINSVNPGAAPVVRSATASSTSAATAAPTPTPSSAAAGYGEKSSYTANSSQAATGLTWGQEESANTSKACEILGKLGGTDAEKLKKLLSEPSMTREEAYDAAKTLETLEGLSPEDRAVVERSVAYGGALANCMAFAKLMMQNIMDDLRKTLKL